MTASGNEPSGDEPSLGGLGDEFAASVGLGGEHAILHLAQMLEDGNYWTRMSVIEELRARGSEQVEQLLLEFVERQQSRRNASVDMVVHAISIIGSETAFQILLSLCRHDDYVLRRLVAHMLEGWLHDPRAVEALFELAADPHPAVRAKALEPLAHTHTEAALQVMLRHVPDTEAYVRRYAALALAPWSGDSRVIEPLFELLADQDGGVAQAASTVIATITVPDISGRLLVCMGSPNAPTRAGAAAALGKLRPPTAFSLLVQTLSDPENLVRENAVRALGEFGNQAAVPNLIALLDDEAWDVCNAAVEALGSLADPRAIAPLAGCSNRAHADSDRGFYAPGVLSALSRCGGDAVPHAIRWLAEHRSGQVREDIVRTLHDLYKEQPQEQIVAALIAALADPSRSVQRLAAHNLRRIASPEVLAAVAAWEEAQQDRDA
jgi:HEAT repeat protein